MKPVELIRKGPQSAQELIGKARSVAQVYCAKAKSDEKDPIKLMFYGPPGIGKSATCRLISNALALHHSSISHLSASQLTIEQVRQWMNDFAYQHDSWRVFWIEEVDKVNPSVEVLLLQFIDELPERHAILVTSNEMMAGIEDRFQSRMTAIRFERPDVDEVEKFLITRWPELGIIAQEIAETNKGDIRASLNDVQAELDARKYGDKA